VLKFDRNINTRITKETHDMLNDIQSYLEKKENMKVSKQNLVDYIIKKAHKQMVKKGKIKYKKEANRKEEEYEQGEQIKSS
jgi:hypothetical protein